MDRTRRLAAIAVVLVAGACGGGASAPDIDDRDFAADAARRCAAVLPGLRPDLKGEAMQPGEVAAVVRERADSLAALVDDLEALDVAPADRQAVRGWLDDWRTYVEVGRRYADALDDGDPETYSEVARLGEGPQRRISAFARANAMAPCALDGVPLPARRSPL